MLKKIISTTGSRILNAFFTLFILWLFTNYVGKRGLGIIALVVLSITIIQLFYDFLAGNPLIYFVSRTSLKKLLIPAYCWIILITIVVIAIFVPFHHFAPFIFNTLVPIGYGFHIIVLSLINGFIQIHYNILIGQGRIKDYNMLFLLQIVLVMVFFTLFVVHGGKALDYIKALYISWSSIAVISFFIIVSKTKMGSLTGWKSVSKKILQFGTFSFAANILHLGNKRLSFYFIKAFAGLSMLGIYNAGVQLAEGVRIIGQSISLVQYSAISGSRNNSYAHTLTIQLMKFSVILTFLALLVLLLIPSDVYAAVLSKDFLRVKEIILYLFPGVLALSANTIFSHYFSGLGHPEINLRTNIAGFIVTVVFALILIPFFGIIGAAITTSMSYITTAVYQYKIFKKQTGTKASDWLLRKEDVKYMKTLFVDLLHKEKLDDKS